jgi:hypothetical protein
MSKSAAIPISLRHAPLAGAIGIFFLGAIALVLLLATTLLLVRGAPPEAIDAITSPPAMIGRTS